MYVKATSVGHGTDWGGHGGTWRRSIGVVGSPIATPPAVGAVGRSNSSLVFYSIG
jgi:hypothetical protein